MAFTFRYFFWFFGCENFQNIIFWPFYLQIYGASYLHTLLQPLIKPLVHPQDSTPVSYEVDPARLDSNEDVAENRRELIALTTKVFIAIVSSADRWVTSLLLGGKFQNELLTAFHYVCTRGRYIVFLVAN